MKPTIHDVARRAGVSGSTVSRVLHGDRRISQATQERVRRALQELQYRPHSVARSLATRSTRTLGLVLPNDPTDLFQNTFFISAMRGLSIVAQARGYHLMYTFSKDEQVEVQLMRDHIDSHWIDGVILFTTRRPDRCVEFLESRSFPFVAIGRPEDAERSCWVDNDNRAATAQITSRLADQGHRRIAFLGGPPEFTVTQERLAGYRQALESRSLPAGPELEISAAAFTEEAGHQGACVLLGRTTVDAIVTTDDVLAFGALRATTGAGRQDVAVTGFNNSERGQYQRPSLTTVDIRPDELGERAGRLLIDLLQGERPVTCHEIVDTVLLERESTLSRTRA